MAGPATLYQTGVHGSRPAASSGCVLYSCTTHSLVYKSDGASWTTWMTIPTGASVATDAIFDAAGDLAVGTGADTAAKLTKGSQGQVLKVGATTLGYTFGLATRARIIGQDLGNADATFNVNSSSYVNLASAQFYHDWDAFPATHFAIDCFGRSNESGQTVTLQFATAATPGTGYSSGGNDVAVGFNGGAVTNWTSGWVAVSGTPSGVVYVAIAFKGSNTTVDIVGRWIDIRMKIV